VHQHVFGHRDAQIQLKKKDKGIDHGFNIKANAEVQIQEQQQTKDDKEDYK